MKRRVLMVLALVLIVPGLLMTTACSSKKQVKSDIGTPGGGSIKPPPGGGSGGGSGGGGGVGVQPDKGGRGTIDAARDRFVNEDVHYAYNTASLDSQAQAILQSKAEWMRSNSETVTIEGHCDERGTSEYNLALGEKRAQSAKKFLTNLGIAGSRMNTVSYGKERPLDPGHSEASWARNRRAHFELK